MSDPTADGQDALRLIARARRALVEEGHIEVNPLLPAYRALAKAHAIAQHPGAALDAVDVATIQRWRSLGGDALLRARSFVVHASAPRSSVRLVSSSKDSIVEVRAPHSEHAAGDALLLALGLSLESAKLAHGLSAPADVLRAAFATPNDAKVALDALARGSSERDVTIASATSSRVDARLLALHVASPERGARNDDRPVYVVCGDGAWRTHDLLSPFARRLRHELLALVDRKPPPKDDDVYAGVDLLLCDPGSLGVHDERINVERADGFLPAGDGCVVVKCESMSDDVDRRAKEAATNLKRARALIVLVEPHASSLAAVIAALSTSIRAVAIVVDASASVTPAYVSDLASGHVAAIDNAFENAQGTLVTAPSLALSDTHAGAFVDESAFALVQCVLSALATGALTPSTKLALRSASQGDDVGLTRCCLDVLARLGPKKAR